MLRDVFITNPLVDTPHTNSQFACNLDLAPPLIAKLRGFVFVEVEFDFANLTSACSCRTQPCSGSLANHREFIVCEDGEDPASIRPLLVLRSIFEVDPGFEAVTQLIVQQIAAVFRTSVLIADTGLLLLLNHDDSCVWIGLFPGSDHGE
jgi:hypothetical protein